LAVYGNNNRLTAAKIIRRNGMKNWKQALLAIIAIFGIIIGLIACDNGNNDPTYDSVTINVPSSKVEIISGTTFYASGVQFTATVRGNNSPLQTVTWTINENVDTGTTINNGILTVSVNEHGKTLTIKATSTVDKTKYYEMSITAVQCLPSELFGAWRRIPDNPDISYLDYSISTNKLYYDASISIDPSREAYYSIEDLAWKAYSNSGDTCSDYPNGYFISGTLTEILNISSNAETNQIGEIRNRYFYLHTDKQSFCEGDLTVADHPGRNIYLKK
jgi:hypothetical protein